MFIAAESGYPSAIEIGDFHILSFGNPYGPVGNLDLLRGEIFQTMNYQVMALNQLNCSTPGWATAQVLLNQALSHCAVAEMLAEQYYNSGHKAAGGSPETKKAWKMVVKSGKTIYGLLKKLPKASKPEAIRAAIVKNLMAQSNALALLVP